MPEVILALSWRRNLLESLFAAPDDPPSRITFVAATVGGSSRRRGRKLRLFLRMKPSLVGYLGTRRLLVGRESQRRRILAVAQRDAVSFWLREVLPNRRSCARRRQHIKFQIVGLAGILPRVLPFVKRLSSEHKNDSSRRRTRRREGQNFGNVDASRLPFPCCECSRGLVFSVGPRPTSTVLTFFSLKFGTLAAEALSRALE